MTMLNTITGETKDINIIIRDNFPTSFTEDGIKYNLIDGVNVEVCEVNSQGDIIIPSIVVNDKIPYIVASISAKIDEEVTGLTISESCCEIKSLTSTSNSKLNKLIINESSKPLLIGYGAIHLSSTVTPYPNPTNVDEKRTGFRNGYYDGLFSKFPIEHVVINRDIELDKYYTRVSGALSGSYSTVFNDIIFNSPFYGLSKLKSVRIGENVSTICCNVVNAVVNAVPTTLDYVTFGDCDNIEVIVSENPTAPIGGGFTQNVYENAQLFIPNGNFDSYSVDKYWSRFENIKQEDFIPIDTIILNEDVITLDINEEYQIDPIINPIEASIQTLKWESSNESIVTVSENGIIKSGSVNGEAVVLAYSTDGSNISAAIKVYVEDGARIVNISDDKGIVIKQTESSIQIYGKTPLQLVRIYDIKGQLIKSSTEDVIKLNTKGVYILKVGGITNKIIL